MPALSTRTLNPLPFTDLEAHRFEDLVRQLAYDWRRWKSLEPTGRSGSDDGIDIRATELVPITEQSLENEATEPPFFERLWVFQCKREKSFSAREVSKTVAASLVSLDRPPYGFVLAVACDVSKKTRDAFRSEMAKRGIEEFYIWAKGELEDFLFQPKNDRLLFAYFGIALQPRRRNLSTSLRSEISLKKQLHQMIGDNSHDGKLILVRDPSDERYPKKPSSTDPPERWFLVKAGHVKMPGHMVVLTHRFLAATSPDGKHWDAAFGEDIMLDQARTELDASHALCLDDIPVSEGRAFTFRNEYIHESDRALLEVYRAVPFARILAIDSLGDRYFTVPHVLVDFIDTTGPFDGPAKRSLLQDNAEFRPQRIDLELSDETRKQIFPIPLPDSNGSTPGDFDYTKSDSPPLSPLKRDALQAVLTSLNARGETHAGADIGAAFYEGQSGEAIQGFVEWRERVARPVFSSFVRALRNAGHRARVAIRSVPACSSSYRQASESVELRIHFQTQTHFHLHGSMRISLFQTSSEKWVVKVFPDIQRGRSSPTIRPILQMDAATTVEELEGEVLLLIQRVDSEEL